MDPGTAALLASGVQGGAGLASGFSSAAAMRDANAANMEINREQMAFNEKMYGRAVEDARYMSNTAWQRGVADMKKAGINPMLAFDKGGASSPSVGAASSGSLRGVEAVPPVVSTLISTAMEGARVFAEVQRANADVENRRQDTKKKVVETANEVLRGPNINQDTKLKAQQTLREAASARSILADLPAQENVAAIERKYPMLSGVSSWLGERLGKLLGPVAGMVAASRVGRSPVGSRYRELGVGSYPYGRKPKGGYYE